MPTETIDLKRVRLALRAQKIQRSGANHRDLYARRQYAGDPWAYFADVLGWWLTPQQEEALDLMEKDDRVLLPSGNNLGKTFLLGGYGVYRFDAVAALLDEDRELEEQGCQLLLPGPDHDTVYSTIYMAMLEHASRAERRGYPMPGERSERSVLWRVRPRWFVEVHSPPRSVSQSVAHTASGRHHRNQVALVEEGQGVEERLWKATEGMCSSAGNKIISSFNPTEPMGPAFQRARTRGGYRVLHLSAFQHPNVRQRELVIPDAVDFRVIDSRVATECTDRGAYPQTQPEKDHQDFVYALPPEPDSPERGTREDGQVGHPDGQLRVYRPTHSFVAQVLGLWPQTSDTGLFDPARWDQGVDRWLEGRDPDRIPDRVGLDPAREGSDESCAMPSWGENAETLLLAFAEARLSRNGAVAELQSGRRIRVGEAHILGKGKGPEIARRAHSLWPRSPFNVDETGIGASVLDHGREVLRALFEGVSFAAVPPEPVPGEPWSENLRTAMYVRAAMLVDRGLVDPPDDPQLREEVMAHRVKYRRRVVEAVGPDGQKQKERVDSVLLIEKDEIKKIIGRSPDRADAFVLSLYEPPRPAIPFEIQEEGLWL